MLWATLLSVAIHHGEAADPTLLAWIKTRLDDLLNLGPWTVVIVLGIFITAMPVAVVGFYLLQQRRRVGTDNRQPSP